uniref:Uncharacterized protein n=1 Tax=Cyanoderma ruficeps TaxID=181631 RepID=A0A8C3XEQ2_9PASS
MGHQARMEKEALVDHLDHLVLLGRMVMLAFQVLQDLLEQYANHHADVLSSWITYIYFLITRGQKVILEDLDSQALRVKMVSQENVVHKVLQDLLEQEVDQVLLAQKVPRVLLAHLVPLEAQDCLAYRECQEKEELLEALDQKGTGENLVVKVLMAFLVQEERE